MKRPWSANIWHEKTVTARHCVTTEKCQLVLCMKRTWSTQMGFEKTVSGPYWVKKDGDLLILGYEESASDYMVQKKTPTSIVHKMTVVNQYCVFKYRV